MASRSCLLHISWGGMSKQVKGYVITIHTYVRGRWDLASDRTSFTQPYIAVVITLSDDFLAHFFAVFLLVPDRNQTTFTYVHLFLYE